MSCWVYPYAAYTAYLYGPCNQSAHTTATQRRHHPIQQQQPSSRTAIDDDDVTSPLAGDGSCWIMPGPRRSVLLRNAAQRRCPARRYTRGCGWVPPVRDNTHNAATTALAAFSESSLSQTAIVCVSRIPAVPSMNHACVETNHNTTQHNTNNTNKRQCT